MSVSHRCPISPNGLNCAKLSRDFFRRFDCPAFPLLPSKTGQPKRLARVHLHGYCSLCHLGHLVDVDDFVGDQFFPLVEGGDGHGSILGVGAVDGRRLLAEVLLGAPLGIIRLARTFGPPVAIGVERDALDGPKDSCTALTLVSHGGRVDVAGTQPIRRESLPRKEMDYA